MSVFGFSSNGTLCNQGGIYGRSVGVCVEEKERERVCVFNTHKNTNNGEQPT